MREYWSRLCVRLAPWRSVLFVLLPLSLFLVELFGFCFLALNRENFEPMQLWPLAFGLVWAVLLGGILWLLPRKAARIVYGIVYYLSVLYAAVQTGYYIMFGQMMWLTDFLYASEGADYADVLLSYPPQWWAGLVCLLVLGVVLIWKFPRWERMPMGVAAAAMWITLSVILTGLLAEIVFFFDYQRLQEGSEADRLASEDYGRMQSAEAAYENMFNAHRLYKVCGLNQMLCKDIYAHEIYPLTPGYTRKQKQAAQSLDAYFAAQGEKQENAMTGLLEGKNVVLVLMESMDDWMIGTHTPTLSRLMDEGINFTRFYTPGYGSIRTFNSEFCVNTGSYLSSQGGYAFDYVTNHYQQSLANQLRNNGYSAKTFHYNDPAFYSRGVFSLAMGFEEYVCYQYYVSEADWQMQQYDDLLLFDNEGLCGEFFREGTANFNFVITRSAHLSYKYNEVLSWWGLKKYPAYRYMGGREETNCAYLKAKLVDDLFARMLQELEARGQLENTVIIGVTDHFTYGYRQDDGVTTDVETLFELSGVEQQLLLERTPCFIWGADVPAMNVDKTLHTADLLPTLLNLLGVDSGYDYLGRDAFDPQYDGFVPFSDGSWISGNIGYDAEQGIFFALDGELPELDEDWVAAMHSRVEQFVQNNNLILDVDYYKPHKRGWT